MRDDQKCLPIRKRVNTVEGLTQRWFIFNFTFVTTAFSKHLVLIRISLWFFCHNFINARKNADKVQDTLLEFIA